MLYTASSIGMFTCRCRLISFMHFVPKNPSAIISISICALFTEYPLPIMVPKVRLREKLLYPVTRRSPRYTESYTQRSIGLMAVRNRDISCTAFDMSTDWKLSPNFSPLHIPAAMA